MRQILPQGLNARFSAGVILLVSLSLLGACASTPDPAKVCSADWIKPRVDRAMRDFSHDTKGVFKTLEKTAHSFESTGKVSPIAMFKVMNALKKLGNKMEHGHAMRDMRTLAQTCNDPHLIQTAMTKFMREQGISERFITFLNGLDVYRKMLETGKRPDMKI